MRRFRLPSWLGILPLIACLCIAPFWLFYLVDHMPRYLVVDIPPPRASTWARTSYTTIDSSTGQSNTAPRAYVWRRETSYSETITSRSASEEWQSLIDHFDRNLGVQGWQRVKRTTRGVVPGCDDMLPETAWLTHGINGYVIYRRHDAQPYQGPTLCVAVWTRNTSAPYLFHVVIVTGQQSRITDLLSGLD